MSGKTSGNQPSEEQMMKFLGREAGRIWKKLTLYLEENYDFEPVRESIELDAAIRYRRSGKTLITFYPKKGELTVLIIFGKKEVERFEQTRGEFSTEIVILFDNTRQYHDGKWLHIKVPPCSSFDEILKLLSIKKNPKKPA
ncbi:MAG: DUF3788 domain-containing protein [Candidatus Thorarchaeota archaeon]|nr:DUF3788 domain-containing protein [Candidatus Thorarchaeota archaeon]